MGQMRCRWAWRVVEISCFGDGSYFTQSWSTAKFQSVVGYDFFIDRNPLQVPQLIQTSAEAPPSWSLWTKGPSIWIWPMGLTCCCLASLVSLAYRESSWNWMKHGHTVIHAWEFCLLPSVTFGCFMESHKVRKKDGAVALAVRRLFDFGDVAQAQKGRWAVA